MIARVSQVVVQGARHLRVEGEAVLPGHTHAGVHLVAGVAGLVVGLAGDGLCQVDAGVGRSSGIQLPQGLVGRPAGGIEMVNYVDYVVLDPLKTADGLPELLPRA